MSEAVKELQLFIDNDADLYRQQGAPIRENLSKKFRKGNYDHALAVKLWKYLADNGAKKYAKEYATPSEWNKIFSVADRNEAARLMADDWLAEMEAGNFHDNVKSNPITDGDIKAAQRGLNMIAMNASELRDLIKEFSQKNTHAAENIVAGAKQMLAAKKRNYADNPIKRGAWKKIHGVVQPGGIYQLGNHPVFIYPPNPARTRAPGKWILMDGKIPVGAFVSLKAAKEHYAGDIEAGHHYGNNPATRKGTARPRRNSQITGKPPTKRLVKRRAKNTEPGYFPNPVDGTTRNYIIGEIRAAINNAEASKVLIEKQAYISYAQGIVRACGYLDFFKKSEVEKWHRLLNSTLK